MKTTINAERLALMLALNELLKKLNAEEAARLQSEINEECGVEVQ